MERVEGEGGIWKGGAALPVMRLPRACLPGLPPALRPPALPPACHPGPVSQSHSVAERRPDREDRTGSDASFVFLPSWLTWPSTPAAAPAPRILCL